MRTSMPSCTNCYMLLWHSCHVPLLTLHVFCRLPPEILDEILSYLDASALFTLSFTDKFLYRLANEKWVSCSKGQYFCFARKKLPFSPPCRCSALWAKIYAAEFRKDRERKQKSADEQQQQVVLPTASAVVQDQPLGYSKMVYFRSVAARDSKKWKRHLRTISNYTGLPSQTERVLR